MKRSMMKDGISEERACRAKGRPACDGSSGAEIISYPLLDKIGVLVKYLTKIA
ncbi:unnamed protein product [Amoebophrya sp. A25]|nr:unnamed protein product [Amoebophrya sp. A25]|eukprot:GSA25T00015364001.1